MSSFTSPEHDELQCSSGSPSATRSTTSDYLTGIFLLLLVVLLWTSSNFVIQYVFVGGYLKPFMIAYLSTTTFTLYLLPSYLRKSLAGGSSLSRRWNTNYQPLLAQDFPNEHYPLITRSSRGVEDRLTTEETAKLAIRFCFLWFASNWTLNASLVYTSVASATVLTGTSCIFTLVIGRICRVETFTLIKIVAVLTSFIGVALVSLSDSSASSIPEPIAKSQPANDLAILGDILALLSAVFYAGYVILLKVQIKEESRIDMQLLFGYAGLFNTLLWWPVALLLHCTGVEPLELPTSREIAMAILLNMFITPLIDYTYVIAMLKTTPLVVAVGLSLTIPFAVVGDYLLSRPTTVQVLIGAVLVTGAFIAVGLENRV